MSDFSNWKSFLSRHCEFAQQKPDLCEKYAKTLSENDITLSMLNDLTHELLKEMDINVIGHRLAILKAAKSVASESAAAAATAGTAAAAVERNARGSVDVVNVTPESPLVSSNEHDSTRASSASASSVSAINLPVKVDAALVSAAATTANTTATTTSSSSSTTANQTANQTATLTQSGKATKHHHSSSSKPANTTKSSSDHVDEPIDENETLMKAGVEFRKDFGAYEIASNEIATFELIGRGGHADVFRGRCRGQEVAVKVLQAQNIPDNVRREFMSEVLILFFVLFLGFFFGNLFFRLKINK